MHDDDARDELQAHLDMQAEQLEAMGRSREEAAREARLRFGNPLATLEAIDGRQSRESCARNERRSGVRLGGVSPELKPRAP
ncbi:MAG: hypothetical protein ABS36_16870 [Acidobacteria bacterium SCN 69-37]|nr:MAG: hypothetical protein ABS36_16870 [Acidobacteria bacterium SCN 69-37]